VGLTLARPILRRIRSVVLRDVPMQLAELRMAQEDMLVCLQALLANAPAPAALSPPTPHSAANSLRLAWVSSWQTRCGIAEYSRHLLGAFQRQGAGPELRSVVLCDQRLKAPQIDSLPFVQVRPAFSIGRRDSMAPLAMTIADEQADLVVIQHQAGLLPWAGLADLLEHPALRSRCVVVALHNTAQLQALDAGLRARVSSALSGAARVLVHTRRDISLLQDLGIDNVAWLPHGCVAGPLPSPPRALSKLDSPLIGSTGFILPHKGLRPLLRAAALLRQIWPRLRVRLVTARYLDPVSDAELAACQALVHELGLGAQVEWHTAFEPAERVSALLAECDLLVLPYAPTTESSSAAARQAIASGVPTLVSDLPVFDDLGDAVERLDSIAPEPMAARIAELLRQPQQRGQLQSQAQHWSEGHDWALIGKRLQLMLAGLHAEHRFRQRHG